MGECEVLWRGGTGGPGVCGGKKAWLGSERRPCGGGCRCSGELENTSGVRTGSRGGRVGGLSGGSVSE